ncbi:GNAT family N-acetyltransferase [Geodermatophilus sp. URMC 64]
MRHDVRLDGPAFRLRPVGLNDAPTIVRLRRDPTRSQFLHETPPSVEVQVRWLEAYLERAGDYYWAVERRVDGTTEGFVGVYDLDGDVAEWGRWVLRPGSLAAAESAWLVHQAGFTLLGLESMVTRTLADNRAVVAFHARYGAEALRTLPGHARIGGVAHDAVEARMTRALWETAGPGLLATAERTASLLARRAGTRTPAAPPGGARRSG